MCHVLHSRHCPVLSHFIISSATCSPHHGMLPQAQAPVCCCADPVGGQAPGGVKWSKGLQRSARLHRHVVLAHLHHSILGGSPLEAPLQQSCAPLGKSQDSARVRHSRPESAGQLHAEHEPHHPGSHVSRGAADRLCRPLATPSTQYSCCHCLCRAAGCLSRCRSCSSCSPASACSCGRGQRELRKLQFDDRFISCCTGRPACDCSMHSINLEYVHQRLPSCLLCSFEITEYLLVRHTSL